MRMMREAEANMRVWEEGDLEKEKERDFFTANRPEGFNHSKRRNSYWGYQNFLQEQLCQTVAPQQCPSPK